MQVLLDKALQVRIFEQMEAAYPNEGGGFLLGTHEGTQITIKDITQIENVFAVEEQHHRYIMTPRDWWRLEDYADSTGLSLVGYYHSHPDSPAVPSEYDRDYALPAFIYIISAVEAGKAVDMRVWQLRPDRTQFDAVPLTING